MVSRRFVLPLLVLVAASVLVLPGARSWLAASGQGTASAAGDPVIAAAGDIACDPANPNFQNGNGDSTKQVCLQKQTYNLLTSINPVAVLPLGDDQYYCGGLAAFQHSYALSWGNLLAKTYPVPGNHEYIDSSPASDHTGCDSSNTSASGYFNYYTNAAKEGAAGQGWYSYDVGSWHLIALNSNCGDAGGCGPTSPQGKFLAADLAAHANQCLLAYWHIPLSTSSVYAATNTYPLWKALYAAHADVILNGHAHDYERFAPQAPPATTQANAGVADPKGIVEFVVGTGGSNHTALTSPNSPNTVVTNNTAFGVLQMTLHPTSYDFKFVPIAGQTFTDSGNNVACHNAGAAGAPPAPTLALTANDANDYAPSGGSTVFYNPNAASGSFTVGATANTATAVQFPTVFGSDSVNDNTSPFSKTYTWSSSASANGSFQVTASNSTATSLPSSFTVTRDAAAPTTTAACNGGADCSGSYSGSVSVALSSDDGSGAGVKQILYSTNGGTPSTPYTAPFSVPAGTVVKFSAVDNVGNSEVVKTQSIDLASGGGGGVALVRNYVGFGSTASLTVALSPGSASGDTLVAAIALAAGSSASVTGVTDSGGGTWVKGAVGFQTSTNSRVEIWYRLGGPASTSVTIALSASKAVSANISEWSGSGWALDKSASLGNASGTTASTGTAATTNATDLVIGAINYPAAVTSTLTTGSFTGLADFSSGAGVHGRAAYDVTSTTGSYQTAWSFSGASGGAGGAILALKTSGGAPPTDSTPPTTTIACNGGSCASSFSSTVSVALNATDNSGGSGVAATYYTTDGSDPTVPANRQTYSGAFNVSSTSTVRFYSVDNAGNPETPQSQGITIDPPTDVTPPTTTITCNGGSCAGSFSSTVTVALNATDNSGGSGVAATYYTTDGSDPTSSGTRQPYSGAFSVSSTSTVQFYSVDNAGNPETVNSQAVTITPATDTTPPTTTITCNGGSCSGSFSSTVSVALNATDNSGGSGVAATYYTTDNSDPTSSGTRQTYSGAFNVSSTSTVKFSSVDNAGNPETVNTQVVTITPPADTTPPTTSILCNGGACTGTFTSAVTVTLNATDNSGGSGVAATRYTTNGGDPTTSGTTYTAPFQVTSTSTVKFYSTDNAGNPETVKSQTVTISSGATTTTLAPVADSYVQSTTSTTNFGTQTAIYVDADGIKQSYLKFDLHGITGTVTSVTLKIWAGSSQSTGYQVFGVSNTTWGETTINWSNKPAFAASSSGSSGAVTTGTWTSVTLPVSLVQPALGNFLSLGLSTTSNTNLKLSSRESGVSTAPQLIIKTS